MEKLQTYKWKERRKNFKPNQNNLNSCKLVCDLYHQVIKTINNIKQSDKVWFYVWMYCFICCVSWLTFNHKMFWVKANIHSTHDLPFFRTLKLITITHNQLQQNANLANNCFNNQSAVKHNLSLCHSIHIFLTNINLTLYNSSTFQNTTIFYIIS